MIDCRVFSHNISNFSAVAHCIHVVIDLAMLLARDMTHVHANSKQHIGYHKNKDQLTWFLAYWADIHNSLKINYCYYRTTIAFQTLFSSFLCACFTSRVPLPFFSVPFPFISDWDILSASDTNFKDLCPFTHCLLHFSPRFITFFKHVQLFPISPGSKFGFWSQQSSPFFICLLGMSAVYLEITKLHKSCHLQF